MAIIISKGTLLEPVHTSLPQLSLSKGQLIGQGQILAIHGIIKGLTPKPQTKNEYQGKVPVAIIPDPTPYTSDLKTQYAQVLEFDSVQYTDENGIQVTTPKMTIENIIIVPSLEKIIEKTVIQGRIGPSIKEYIGEGDYKITLNGLFAGANGVYPSDKVAQLTKIVKAPVSIPVINPFLNDLGVYYLTIEDYDIPQEAGKYSTISWTIKALSDTPTYIYVTP